MVLSIIYYIFLLLVFFYFAKYKFPRMSSVPVPTTKPTPVPASDPNDKAEATPEDEFYHHPIWPERWYNSDFTHEARRRWIDEPWYKDTASRDSHRFITKPVFNHFFPWGFIIYRTVYTDESDILWPLAMEKISDELNSSIEGSLRYAPPSRRGGDDSSPEQLIQASHKDVVICDAIRWDGASIEQVRNHFAEYLRKTGQAIYCDTAICFVSCY
ncbi:hypothetical protein N7456_008405 [Penicillium angulare]|uniref:Uncharacterized protein n=1 Tax=Penicillium angulare TaxID=116970 RepID=A0A9W9FCR4_9EURO|nr:hypothetical protein N7456_008405 [Penicillium angulare]